MRSLHAVVITTRPPAHPRTPFAVRLSLLNPGLHNALDNTALAEQKNSVLRCLESSVSFTRQTNFLFYFRYCLYKLNDVQRKSNSGSYFTAELLAPNAPVAEYLLCALCTWVTDRVT